MQLNFDTENTGSLDIQKHFGAQRVEQLVFVVLKKAFHEPRGQLCKVRN